MSRIVRILFIVGVVIQCASLSGEDSSQAATETELFGCRPLEERVVTACSLGVTAEWRGSFPNYRQSEKSKTCTYNPPPGWVILETKVRDKKDNNGSYSVDTLAGGLNLISTEEIDSAYEELFEKEFKYAEIGVQRKMHDRQTKHKEMLIRHSTTHNTLIAKVEASTHGNEANRKRGWMKMKVDARIVCLGAPAGKRTAGGN